MFLEPGSIGRGFGRLMWDEALSAAAAAGFASLLIESDRYAEPFYLAMGAVRVGPTPSPVDGAPLPLLRVELAARQGYTPATASLLRRVEDGQDEGADAEEARPE